MPRVEDVIKMSTEEPLFVACGQRLRDCRLANKQTVEQIATYLRVSKSRISRWENGKTQKIPLSIIEQLAHLWGVSPVWLMDKEVAKYTSAPDKTLESDNALVEAAFNLFRLLSEKEQEAVLTVIRAIADKYSTDNV